VCECVFVGVTGRDCAREGVRARERESVCEREGWILRVDAQSHMNMWIRK